MLRTTSPGIRLAVAGALALAALPAAAADTLRVSIGFPPGGRGDQLYQSFVQHLDEYSGGSLTGKVYPLNLLSFKESLPGLRDGIADVALVPSPYFPSELPVTNFLHELVGLGEVRAEDKDVGAMALIGAINEYMLLECDACEQEAMAHNQVALNAGTSSRYNLLCAKPVYTAEQLEGVRIRAGGAFYARWAKAMGATPVTMSGNEEFEALSQGVLECTTNAPYALIEFGLAEAAPYINTSFPGGGSYSDLANVNLQAWQGLTDDQRRAMLHAAADLSAELYWSFREGDKAGVEKALSLGGEIRAAEPSLEEKSEAYLQEDLQAIVANYRDNRGVANAPEIFERLTQLFDRWVPLVQDVDGAEAMAEVLWREVHSRVDPADYGM
ncbi:C4-dicarboxylate TRAP transporter substrate-binding protein [Albimonas sp. CAU 1670]|uniref:C4-dicarboxylate TRAP transporter substrate-binding protein n=1 Tax=Albimonas sp. CAU 1670 TaxID=3032599 RepID=UPI0023DB3C37|nr:C4-dicarboxylate TRAP transporter substrate-binding protein [Albimonas sp. CAU 1670]MDF2231293.1 C4-dicarboxylate TRAP transporter substrate-binding protein [Albimonas sp. CAU 1670]